MAPKDLKCPFTWEERAPVLSQGVLFVPKYYDKHGFSAPLFAEKEKVYVEYCSGNGHWIIEKAREHPQIYWVAVERQFERVRKIWSKMQNFGLHNVLIVCGEAEIFSKFYLQERSIDGIYVNFPDPWPKTKHAKNRLIQAPFVEELSRTVKEGGSAVCVTDDVPYAQQIVQEMTSSPHWKSVFKEPFYQVEWENYGASCFDTLWRGKGREIRYLHFNRTT